MFIATIEKRIAKLTNATRECSFNKPVETITGEMYQDASEIYTLRQAVVNLNGRQVSADLSFCPWMESRRYSVWGRLLDGTSFAEDFDTQDEAEQEYIVRASYVWSCMTFAASELGAELLNIGAKTHCLEQDAPITDADLAGWVPEKPMLPPASKPFGITRI